VRYPVDKLEKNNLNVYETITLDSLEIVSPGSFGLSGGESKSKCTVFMTCDSDILESLSYKPDYPDSVFHITLYDGYDYSFASRILLELSQYPWGFVLPLPHETRLTRIHIGKSKAKSRSLVEERKYSPEVKDLFSQITSLDLSADIIRSLSDDEKIRIVGKICTRIRDYSKSFDPLPEKAIWQGSLETSISSAQPNLFLLPGKLVPDLDGGHTPPSNHSKPELAYENAVFLTPPELAHEISEYALNLLDEKTPIAFGDPAVGNGSFFSALCRCLGDRRIESAIGVEIDQDRAQATHARWSNRGLHVLAADFLRLRNLPKRSLVLANPPYVKYQKINAVDGKIWQEHIKYSTGLRVGGQAGLYVYFLLQAHEWLEPGALSAWLIPSEFLETNYGKAIRDYLTTKVSLIRLHKYGITNMQFENALVTSAVVVFKNVAPSFSDVVEVSSEGSLVEPENKYEITIDALFKATKWKIPLGPANSVTSALPTIGDLFVVRRGIATGSKKFFVLTRQSAEQLGIDEALLKPVMPKVASLASNVVESNPDGFPLLDEQLCLLDSDLPIETIREKYPRTAEYLESASEEIRSKTLVARRHPWYKQETRSPAPFLCSYMARKGKTSFGLRFVLNKSEAVATNNYHMLYPKPDLQKILDQDPTLYVKLLDLLNGLDENSVLAMGRSYGGGLLKVEPGELQSVPIGTTPEWLRGVLNRIGRNT
jgi:adenine-specific DNA-methyltransferase